MHGLLSSRSGVQSALEGRIGDCKAAGEEELRFNCPRCRHEDHRLYINPDKVRNGIMGWFFCHECHFKGTLEFLFRYLGLGAPDEVLALSVDVLRQRLIQGVVRDETPPRLPLELPQSDVTPCVYHRASLEYLLKRGLTEAQVASAQLFVRISDGYRRIYFPELDTTGDVVYAVSRRYLDDDNAPKYSSIGNSVSRGVYRLTACGYGAEIVVTEGPIDALVLWDNAVALYGTFMSPTQFDMLHKASNRFVIALDDDATEFSQALCTELMSRGCTVRWVELPGGDDPAAIGRARFDELREATPVLTPEGVLRRRVR